MVTAIKGVKSNWRVQGSEERYLEEVWAWWQGKAWVLDRKGGMGGWRRVRGGVIEGGQ